MIRYLVCSLLMAAPGYLLSELPQEETIRIKKWIEAGSFKKAIKALENETSADSLVLLAAAYYKDQEHAKAFDVFLKALAVSKKEPAAQISKDEAILYADALKIYMDPSVRDPVMTSLKIRDLYAGIWRLHPEYAELGYLVAIAYANLGEYPDFFEIFYESYKKIPDHFLAYKAQGILHLKLYDRGRTLEEKDKERARVLYYFNKAKELYPQDYSLYKMEIAFSPDKEQALETNLKEILDRDIVIPRTDLSFYIDQLLAYGKNDLAAEFIARARKWYPYSRTLDAADDILKSKTKGK